MKRLTVEPNGWPCTLRECPPGHFVIDNLLCFKSEYFSEDGYPEVYNEAGEYFCAGSKAERDILIVQPVMAIWNED